MKHTVKITPMNSRASYNSSVANTIFVDYEDYKNSTDRATYIRDIEESWFRLKSGSLTSYLEPFVKDLYEGDVVTFEFDVNFLSGSRDLKVDMYFVDINKKTLKSQSYNIDEKNLPPYNQFKRLSIDVLIYNKPVETEIIVFNIRPFSSVKGSEMIVKNVEMIVDTKNNKFSTKDNIVSYKDKSDYRKLLNMYSMTDIISTYQTLRSNYKNNLIDLSDGIDFVKLPTNVFKGVFANFVPNPKLNIVAYYFEYKVMITDSAYGISTTGQLFDEDNKAIISTKPSNSISLATESKEVWKKKIHYIDVDNKDVNKVAKQLIVDIGNMMPVGKFKIRNIHIALPRHDAHRKDEPNKIENLFDDYPLQS